VHDSVNKINEEPTDNHCEFLIGQLGVDYAQGGVEHLKAP
jgi:hypothetical protein